MKDINTTAASLIAGGWLPEDAELLQAEYGLDDDELAEVITEMTRLLDAEEEDAAQVTAEDIVRRGLYNAAVELMDNELREQLHEELSPCSDAEFLTRYLIEHEKKFHMPFIVR